MLMALVNYSSPFLAIWLQSLPMWISPSKRFGKPYVPSLYQWKHESSAQTGLFDSAHVQVIRTLLANSSIPQEKKSRSQRKYQLCIGHYALIDLCNLVIGDTLPDDGVISKDPQLTITESCTIERKQACDVITQIWPFWKGARRQTHIATMSCRGLTFHRRVQTASSP